MIGTCDMKKPDKNMIFLILMVLAMLSWGGSWTSAKLIVNRTAPEVLIFWRFLATFLSFIPLVVILKVPLKLDKKGYVLVLAAAVLLMAYNKLFFQGLRTGLAGGGGVLVTTINPLFTFLYASLLFRQKIHFRELLGLLLGLGGGLVLLQVWSLSTDKLLMSGNLLFIAAAAVWAMLSITSQKSGGIMSTFAYSFYVYGLSALISLPLSLSHHVFDISGFGLPFWLNILFLSVIVTTFGTTAYFFAAGRLGASRASSFMFLVPTSAVFFSWTLLGEKPGLTTFIGGFMALTAVYIINKRAAAVKGAESNTQHLADA
jgi:drug/metabolite transporter (DMT)-like permease